jgi:uncharacterized protein YbjT (DUF2867 family)
VTTSPNAPFQPSTPRRVLVAGATGYVGGRLVPDLLAAGHHVTALARDPRKLDGRPFVDDPRLEVRQGDVLDAASLAGDLDGIDVAYYLVHSMRGGDDFEDTDIRAARTFGAACADAGVVRIVYLSGLGEASDDALSPHLQSRHDTGAALREAGVPVTELRAAIIVGSGSASFDIIHDIVARLPVMVTPRWVRSLCEPIAIRDVTWYLVSVLDEPRTVGEILEIGSGDVMPYEDLLRVCAEELDLPIRNVTVPVLSPGLSARWLHLVTDVDYAVARPLVEGLRNDVVCTDLRIREWLPHDLSSYRVAVRRALAKRQHPTVRESRWTDAQPDRPLRIGTTNERNRLMGLRIAPDRREFRDYRTFDTDLSPEEVFRRVSSIGGPGGYGIRAEMLWQLRGALDRVTGGPGLRRGRPFGRALHPGDALDFWRVEEVEPDERLVLTAEMRAPGAARLEFRVEPLDHGGSRLHQLATLSNDTLWSGLYWYTIAPLHDWVFDQLGAHVLDDAKSSERDAVGS